MNGNGALTIHQPTNVESWRASTDAAGMCGEIVKKTAMNIQGRRYVKLEGWQALAIAHGCVASADQVERVNDEGMGGFRAIGIVRRMSDGAEISRAEGFVGDDEKMWAGRPVYARRAMVQSRAISRACRSAFAHVVVLIDSNLSTTPAEEVPMGGFDNGEVIDQAPREDRRVKNPKTGRLIDPMSPNQARQDGRGARYDALRHEITDLTAVTDCIAWGIANKAEIDKWPEAWRDDIRRELSDHMGTLRALAAKDAGADLDTGEILEGDDIPDFPGDRPRAEVPA